MVEIDIASSSSTAAATTIMYFNQLFTVAAAGVSVLHVVCGSSVPSEQPQKTDSEIRSLIAHMNVIKLTDLRRCSD